MSSNLPKIFVLDHDADRVEALHWSCIGMADVSSYDNVIEFLRKLHSERADLIILNGWLSQPEGYDSDGHTGMWAARHLQVTCPVVVWDNDREAAKDVWESLTPGVREKAQCTPFDEYNAVMNVVLYTVYTASLVEPLPTRTVKVERSYKQHERLPELPPNAVLYIPPPTIVETSTSTRAMFEGEDSDEFFGWYGGFV